MATEKNDAKKTETPKKRKLGNQLQQFLPFVRWYSGLIICGEITRKFQNTSNYGEKSNLELKLLDPCTFTNSDGEVIELKEGEGLNVGSTAGLSTAMTLPVGTTVQIECVGKKELGQGKRPAWEFIVEYE